ncbi:MAG: hypothetical protein LCH56_04060 [Proteobacteria bacterium]|nr:hypothetical protein [Pseudomonadota bacterium]
MKERIPFVVAVAATVVWLAVVGLYLSQMSWPGLMALEPMALAALLTATAGPLVALWLVMVVLEQRRAAALMMQRFAELANQERRTQQQAETLARSITEMQRQSTDALSSETRKLALQDLASSAAVLAERLGVMKRDVVAATWVRFGAGDTTVFVQAFLNFAGAHPDIAERIGEAAVRDQAARAALAGFVRRYEQLADLARSDKLLRAVIEDGALGRGYRLFKQADDLAALATTPHVSVEEAADDLRDRLDGLSRRLETVGDE